MSDYQNNRMTKPAALRNLRYSIEHGPCISLQGCVAADLGLSGAQARLVEDEVQRQLAHWKRANIFSMLHILEGK
jgi:hypothetical protein